MIQTITWLLSWLTVLGQIFIFVFLFFLITKRKAPKVLQNNGVRLAFVVAFIATFGSLFYSDVAKYTPCVLCWYQRIFMYSQAVLLGLAFYRKNLQRAAIEFSLVFSSIGAAIAAFNYYLQISDIGATFACTTVGYSISCAETFFMNLGYITIPMMSLTAFLLIIIALVSDRQASRAL